MKKINKILLVSALFATSLGLASLIGSCGGESEPQNGVYEKEYTVEYGSEFSIPSTIKSSYKVLDGKGKQISVVNGKFVATDGDGYTVKVGKDEIKITVKDTTAPTIRWQDEYIQIERGKSVDFSNMSAYDLKTGVTLVELYEDGGDVKKPITGGKFKPTETGKYTVLAKSSDAAGNVAEKNIYVEALEKGDEKFNRITAFSESYGVTQVTNLHGFSAEYSTEEKYENENGSLKLTANLDVLFGSQSNRFRLSGLFKQDVSDTYGVYFRVKNTGAIGKTLQIGRTITYNLQPGVWTEIYLSDTDFKNIQDEQKIENAKADLTALDFCVYTLEATRLGFSEMFISDIYYLPSMDTVTFDKNIEELSINGITDKETMKTWTTLSRIYGNYTEAQRLASKKGYLVEKIYMDSLTKTYNVTREELRLTYADGGFAPYQFISKDKSATMRYDATKTCDNGKGEIGSMRVDTGDCYGASLILQYPLVGADNSTLDVDDTGEDGLFGTVTFSMYFDPEIGKTALVSYNGQLKEVEAGEWVELTFKTKNKTFKNNTLYVYAKTENGYGGWLNDATFWMTSIYATYVTTAAQVDQMIQELLDADIPAAEFAESELYLKAFEGFSDLSVYKRETLTKKDAFKAELKEKLLAANGVQEKADKVFYFDSQVGVNQVLAYKGVAEYTEEMKYDGDEGNGCLKMTFTGNNWDVGIDLLLPFEEDRSLLREYKLYVYMDGSKDNKINFGSWSSGDDGIVLVEDQWVEFTIPAGQYLDTNRLFFYANDWATLLPQGLTVYFSAVRAA